MDLSPAAIAWAQDRARDADAEVHFLCGDAFALTATGLGRPV
ncbi:MAG: class I SAM-dependent methyltransferase [Pseudonocardiaceae bacterium]